MEEKHLDLLRCKGRVRNGADGRFYASVRYRDEDDGGLGALGGLGIFGLSSPALGSAIAMAPFADPDIEAIVLDWCKDNCVGEFEPFGKNTIVFSEQEDAILFMMRLSR